MVRFPIVTDFYVVQNVKTGPWNSPSPYSVANESIAQAGKRQEREADYSPPPSAEGENEWS